MSNQQSLADQIREAMSKSPEDYMREERGRVCAEIRARLVELAAEYNWSLPTKVALENVAELVQAIEEAR